MNKISYSTGPASFSLHSARASSSSDSLSLPLLAFHFSSTSVMANSLLLFPHNLPVGWRFDPTDEELVDHYLKRKRRGDPIYGLDIGEVKLSDYNPWDLPSLSNNKSKDKMWFFFSLREYCNNGVLRKAGKGSWKSTGDPRSVTPEGSDEEIGTKRTLVFHNPGATHWVMHEYEFTAELNSPVKGNYVLCKIKENPCEKKKTVKRPMKAEPSCKKPRTKKKARKGESDFNMASVSPSLSAFEDQKSKETMGNSTYVVGEPSIRNHMISGLGNQKSNKMPAIPTCENGELSNLEAFDSDNQSQCEMTPISTCIQGEIGSISSFSNQISCQMTDASFSNGGEARCPMASDLENYNPNNMACMLSYKNCETRCLMASDLENYSPNQMTAMPSCKKGKRSCPAASGLENQNSYNDITIVSTNNECETICPVIFDENQNSNEMTNESFYEKGKPNYLGAVDFENQNPSKSIGISTSTEGVWSSLFEEFSDFDNQNQYQKTDVSLHKDYSSSYVASNVSLLKGYPSPYLSPNIGEITFQEAQSQNKVTDILIPNYQSPLMTSNFQGAMLQNPIYTTERPILEDNCPGMVSDGREATFPEMDPQLVEELTAFFELEDCVNSAPEQPSHTMESQSKSIDISASAEGVKSSLFETPSDFDNQNRYEKTDVSLLKGYPSPYLSPNIGEITFQEAQSQNKVTDILIPNYQSPLMTSNFQGAMLQNPIYTTERPILEDNCPGMVSDRREATFPEMDPQLVEELTAFFELEDCVNSAPEQPSHTMESQSKSIDISASAEGVKSSLFETPSDFDNQNRYEKTDVSLLKGYPSPYLSPNIGEITLQEAQSQNKVTDILIPNYQSPLMTSNFQGAMLQNPIYTTERPILEDNCPGMVSDGREATFPEMDPQMVEEY